MSSPLPRPVDANDPRLGELLAACSLPTEDLGAPNQRFWSVADEDGRLLAAAGLEVYGTDALLRSLAASPDCRNQGMAALILDIVLDDARTQDLKALYLLTETAEGYFQKKGFCIIGREDAPVHIRAAPQFAGICPGNATAMMLAL